MSATVRRVRADEWPEVRVLRLDALRDPDAPLAFIERYDDAVRLPDAHWQGRAARSSAGDDAAQFVAVDGDAHVGTVTVIVQAAGSRDHHGVLVERSRAVLMGVFVRPAFRRTDVTDALLDAAATWCSERGFPELLLYVHRDNSRAQVAYRRAGFLPTGVASTSVIGPEIEMVRTL